MPTGGFVTIMDVMTGSATAYSMGTTEAGGLLPISLLFGTRDPMATANVLSLEHFYSASGRSPAWATPAWSTNQERRAPPRPERRRLGPVLEVKVLKDAPSLTASGIVVIAPPEDLAT